MLRRGRISKLLPDNSAVLKNRPFDRSAVEMSLTVYRLIRLICTRSAPVFFVARAVGPLSGWERPPWYGKATSPDPRGGDANAPKLDFQTRLAVAGLRSHIYRAHRFFNIDLYAAWYILLLTEAIKARTPIA